MTRQILVVLALVAGASFLASCDDEGGGSKTPAPPQAFITIDESSFIRPVSQGVTGRMNASGCKKIVGLEVWDGTTFLKQYGNPDGGTTVPVDFKLDEGLFTDLYKERGIALQLSLRTKVTCDDGRSNFSQSVGTNFFPVVSRKPSPVAGEFTVPENFVGEGTGGDHVNFLGCTGNGAGGSQLTRVDGTTFEVLASNTNMPAGCECTANTYISPRNTHTDTRWLLNPGSCVMLIDNNSLQRIKYSTGPYTRIGVSPDDDSAAIWVDDSTHHNVAFIWPEAGSTNDWVAQAGGFMISTPVITTDAVWTAHFVQNLGSANGNIILAKWGKTGASKGTSLNRDVSDPDSFGHIVHTLTYDNIAVDTTIVPEGAFYSDGTNFMFPVWTSTASGVATHISNCSTGPLGQCTFPAGGGLPGVFQYIIPFSGNAIVAALSAKAVYFLNGTTPNYTPLNNNPLIPTPGNVVAGVQWATNGQFYVATRPASQPQPNELIGIDTPQAGELWRMNWGGGTNTFDGVNLTVAGNDAPPSDTSLFVWVRLGPDLVKLQSPSWYRGRRGPTP